MFIGARVGSCGFPNQTCLLGPISKLGEIMCLKIKVSTLMNKRAGSKTITTFYDFMYDRCMGTSCPGFYVVHHFLAIRGYHKVVDGEVICQSQGLSARIRFQNHTVDDP